MAKVKNLSLEGLNIRVSAAGSSEAKGRSNTEAVGEDVEVCL